MTAQDLKNSIMQLAIQGKLVEQRVEEGTAKELVEQIKDEKEQLIKEKKIKKEKPLPEITEEEIPFEIPESWEWVRFGDLGSFKKGPFGSALTKAIFVPKGSNTIKVYEQKNAIQKSPEIGNYYITNEYFKSKMTGFELFPGDIIVSCAGTIGETFIMPEVFEKGIINQALMKMNLLTSINKEYFLLYFDFILKKNAIKSSKGSAIKNIPPFDELKSYLVPIPPCAEQNRILGRIEELRPHIEQYDKAHSKLEVFNKKFPEDMQKSILQYAIQGKLVEQRPEEGTAEDLYQQIQEEKERLIKEGKIKKEKPLSDIAEDEIPFEIPESWKWVYINEVCFVTKLAGFEYTKYLANAISSVGDIPIVRAQNIKPNRFIENETEYISAKLSEQLDRSALNKRCVLMTFIGAGIGEVAIFEFTKRAHLAPNVAKIVPHIDINDYILFYLMSDAGRRQIFQYMKQTAQPSLSMETIRKGMIPLPPLAEQKRIVAKVKELLPYVHQIMK